MKYLIIDDEPIAHRIIEGYCAELPHLEKVGNAYNAFEASAIIAKFQVDIIFLDLNMPKLSGFEWLQTLRMPPAVIVTTAYQEYALEGFELSVVDYLLKPFSLARFLTAVNKVNLPANDMPATSPSGAFQSAEAFFLKGDKKHHRINPAEIIFIEAYGNYCKVYFSQEMILSHEKISTLETILPSGPFLRVHKSFIVAADKIRHIQGNIIHLDKHQVPVGQTYRGRIGELLSR